MGRRGASAGLGVGDEAIPISGVGRGPMYVRVSGGFA